MQRVAASADLPTPQFFWAMGNAQKTEPTAAWTVVSSPSASTMYSFLHLSGVGRALWANSGPGFEQACFKPGTSLPLRHTGSSSVVIINGRWEFYKVSIWHSLTSDNYEVSIQ